MFGAGGIEPFDEGLDRHIWSLSDQRLQWDGEIAQKRREKPDEVQRLMQELLDNQRAIDDMEAEEYAAVVAEDGSTSHEPDRESTPFALQAGVLTESSAGRDVCDRGRHCKKDVCARGRAAAGAWTALCRMRTC